MTVDEFIAAKKKELAAFKKHSVTRIFEDQQWSAEVTKTQWEWRFQEFRYDRPVEEVHATKRRA